MATNTDNTNIQTTANNQGLPQDDKFDLTGLLLEFVAKWKWFVLSILVCLGLTYLYIARIVPIYDVSASVYLNDDSATRTNSMMMQQNVSLDEMKTYIDETEIEILRSKNNLIKIVDSLGLSYSYAWDGMLRPMPIYKTSPVQARLDSATLRSLSAPITLKITQSGKKIQVEAQQNIKGENLMETSEVAKFPANIKIGDVNVALLATQADKPVEIAKPLIIKIKNPNSAAAELAGNLNIEFAKNSFTILRINLHTQLPDQGKDIINTLIDFYNQQLLDDKNRSAIQTEAFILDRLKMISGELRDVEERLRSYREQHNIADISAQTAMNLTQKSNTESRVSEVDAQIRILDEIEAQVRRADPSTTIPSVANNPIVAGEIEAYNKLVANYIKISRDLADDNDRLVDLRQSLNEQRSLVQRSIHSARSALREQRNAIASIGGASTSQLSAQPTIDKGLQEIFREQSVKVNIYTFLLQKREEIAIQKTMATPTAQLIDNPTGSGPISPNRMLIYPIGFLIGLLIPALIIYLRRTLMPKFKDQEELERLTTVPIIGEICNDASNEDVVIGRGVATPIAELFRLLRNNIKLTRSGSDKKVILITSTISGEGKSFIALNTAMSYALTGKKVLMIGLDIRRPVLARTCRVSNKRGITTYLSDQEDDVQSLIVPTPFNENLFILPAGPIPPNPNELLMSDRMEQLFKKLRQEYDYIIVDTSPIGMISDTFLFTHLSDVQIYVTRASYSSRKSLKVLHNAIRNNYLPNCYILVNGVNMTSSTYIYRRYGHYGFDSKKTYGYGYGYGYKSDDDLQAARARKKSKSLFKRKS